jgi:hypothetical protein
MKNEKVEFTNVSDEQAKLLIHCNFFDSKNLAINKNGTIEFCKNIKKCICGGLNVARNKKCFNCGLILETKKP